MALPQQVIDRLSKEPPKTPGWSFGAFTFSAGFLFLAVITYFGLTLGYEPYLDSQLSQVTAKIAALTKSISPDDQTKLITFYSELSNLKTVLANHVAFYQFFGWGEKNNEANVYYSRLAFSAGNNIALTGIAANEADVNQQMAIFEADPAVTSVNLSNAALSDTDHVWQFTVALTINPASVLRASP